MLFYDSAMAPNPRRVRIFLAEKGIDVPSVQVNIAAAENRAPEFQSKNSLGQVPVLELDDGSHLTESVAICRYFEELHPDPPLFGTDAVDRARVEMWNRRMEFEVAMRAFMSFQNTHDFFKGRLPQVPEFGEVCQQTARKRLAWLDTELAEREFVAGDRFTIADITALVGIDFGRVSGIKIQPDQKNLTSWHEAVSSRASAKA